MPKPSQFRQPDPHDTPRTTALAGTVGSDVYNTRLETSDLDWKHYMFPSVEDLYANQQPSYERHEPGNDRVYRDARLLAHQLKRTNLNTLEVLYSPRLDVHPSLAELVDSRDDLARVDLPRFFDSTLGTFRQHRDAFRRSLDDVNHAATVRHGYDPKPYAHLHRLRYLLTTYMEHDFDSLRPALRFPDGDPFRDVLLALRGGVHTVDEAVHMTETLEQDVVRLKAAYHARPPGATEAELGVWLDELVKGAVLADLARQLR